MNVAQFEHIPTFTEPLPSQDTFDRLDQLFQARRNETILAKTGRLKLKTFDVCSIDARQKRSQIISQITQSAFRLAAIDKEIIRLAGEIAVKYAALETTM